MVLDADQRPGDRGGFDIAAESAEANQKQGETGTAKQHHRLGAPFSVVLGHGFKIEKELFGLGKRGCAWEGGVTRMSLVR